MVLRQMGLGIPIGRGYYDRWAIGIHTFDSEKKGQRRLTLSMSVRQSVIQKKSRRMVDQLLWYRRLPGTISR